MPDKVEPQLRPITVTGKGKVTGKPDKATITVTVKTIAATAAKTREQQSKTVKQVNAALMEHKIEGKDLQSSSFDFGQHFKRTVVSGDSVADGFYATNSLTVKVRELNAVAKILDSVVAAG